MKNEEIKALKIIIVKRESEMMRVANIARTYENLIHNYRSQFITEELRNTLAIQFRDIHFALERNLTENKIIYTQNGTEKSL